MRRSAARRPRGWKRHRARVASMHLQGRQRLLAAALMLVSAGMAAAYGPMGVRVNAVKAMLIKVHRCRFSNVIRR